MRNFSLLIFFLFYMISACATRTEVSSASAINSKFWFPGDTIVMLNGTWTNQSISFKAEGSPEAPIVLMAETPGKVILNGSSKLAFSGKFIIVMGLYFKDGTLSGSDVISFRTSSASLAENCTLTNTSIHNYNPALNTTDSKWVSIYGRNNKVDHCSFVNKSNSGTLLVVWLTSGVIPNHIIDHNYFGYRNANLDSGGAELNGQEIIRIGDSSTSMQTAGVVVSNNFFEHCNGEIEVISNKSCENIYINNVFYECAGMLTLRHGNRCTVEGNYFFGNGIANTGGVRVIGEDHKVFNNYFEKLQGTTYRAALCLVRGKENSALNEYYQVKNVLVAFNTMVDCKQSFSINYNSSTSLTMPPIGCTIAHNHVYNTSTSNNNVTVYQVNVAAMDVTWRNNLINTGTYTSFPYTPAEIIVGINPSMSQSETTIKMYEPEAISALVNYSTVEYPDIMLDIRARSRGSVKIPGASQISGVTTREMPQKSTSGADYYTTSSGKLVKPLKKIDINTYVSNHQVYIQVYESGILSVYDLFGKCLFQQKLLKGSNNTSFSKSGLFILKFQTDNGDVTVKKILCD